jgi:hypothetical protein
MLGQGTSMSTNLTENAQPDQTSVPLRRLTQEELESFREDYRELEKEIQSFFRVYYLSGLILVAAWLTGPQSRPLLELAVGNGGYNIYAPIAIASLNMISSTFLIYKSISIHEISQFMTYMSKTDSAFNYWETWRRNHQGAEYYARFVYGPLLILVPLFLSGAILYATYHVLYTPPETLIERIRESQPPDVPTSAIPAVSITAGQQQELDSKVSDTRKVYAQRIKPVLDRARLWFWIIGILHLVPFVWLVYLNTVITARGWEHVRKAQDTKSLFRDLRPSLALFSLKKFKSVLRRTRSKPQSKDHEE